MMKKIRIVLLVTLLFLLFSVVATAHSGRTDENGGHYDRSTGEYHYHHGYSAHQHTNGECPYSYKKTTVRYTTRTTARTTIKTIVQSTKSNDTTLIPVLIGISVATVGLIALVVWANKK